jgi:hypothetical protein
MENPLVDTHLNAKDVSYITIEMSEDSILSYLNAINQKSVTCIDQIEQILFPIIAY